MLNYNAIISALSTGIETVDASAVTEAVTQAVTEASASAVDIGASIDRTIPLADRLAVGVETLIVGMGTVFAVLVILMVILSLFKVFFYKPENSGVKPEPKPEPAPVVAEPAPAPVAQTDDGEIIAAITAAVAAYLDAEAQAGGAESYTGGFRVVSFRRASRR